MVTRILLFSFISLFFTTLGAATPIMLEMRPPPGLVDPEFQKYIKQFIVLSKGKANSMDFTDVSIIFSKLEFSEKNIGVIGLCHWGFPGLEAPYIEIDRNYWESHSSISRWSLIFHEMGHCILGREHPMLEMGSFIKWLESLGIKTIRHQENYLKDGCPKTLMHPYDFSDSCITDHLDYYIKELYTDTSPTQSFIKIVHGEFLAKRAPLLQPWSKRHL